MSFVFIKCGALWLPCVDTEGEQEKIVINKKLDGNNNNMYIFI